MTYRQADRVVKNLQRKINKLMSEAGKLELELNRAYTARHIAWLNESPVAQKIQAQLSATSSTL
jgi:DNA-directed RNA polymerase specialized sigma subunit